MVGFEFFEDGLPVPRSLESKFVQGAEELVQYPFLHKLLERIGALFHCRQIVHADSGENGKYPPVTPKPLIHQVLSIFWIVFHHLGEDRMTNLSMARLIGLNACY